MSGEALRDLEIRAGFATRLGRRPENEDYGAVLLPGPAARARQGVVAAIADGVGGEAGGRVAAELTVRGFIDAYYAQPETLGVRRAASRAIASVNRWIFDQGRSDPRLRNMATTFSAVILRQRRAQLLHIGDSRIYRLRRGQLAQLTADHNLSRQGMPQMLQRAIGFEEAARLDFLIEELRDHDRLLLCTDGVHGVLAPSALLNLLGSGGDPDETAERIVETAIAAGGTDNASCVLLDVIAVPPADQEELEGAIAVLPIRPLPKPGEIVDGFRLTDALSIGRYSCLFRAEDCGAASQSSPVVLKFPRPEIAEDRVHRMAFLREAWVAARLRSPWVGEVIEVAPERQTRLYSVMPYYTGETLEARLGRQPLIGLREGIDIASKLAKALAALHRAGIIHRDLKPDNVILTAEGGLRLIDLGVARFPGLEEFPEDHAPGTPSYMAPELFQGAAGDERSDLYALGVTIFRIFGRDYPYGEIEPFTRPRFGKPKRLATLRPDLPAWLDLVISRAIAVDPDERYADALEFAAELEAGVLRAAPLPAVCQPLYQRNPLAFWQGLSALLFIATLTLAILLARR